MGARSPAFVMDCQVCKKNTATVHITEVMELSEEIGQKNKLRQKHVCEGCANLMDLPHAPLVNKSVVDIWKLLQKSAQLSSKESGLQCPDCGMTLSEFRSKGRLGCAKDYEIFHEHLEPLLWRIHGASEHVGRLPGLDNAELGRMRTIHDLRSKLDVAIRKEAYEDAAKLRDELEAIDGEETP